MNPLNNDSLLVALSRHIGAENGIHVDALAAEAMGCNTLAVDAYAERNVRHIITALRMEGQHICGDPTRGYFMAGNVDELEQTCEFLYARAMTSLTQVARMKRLALPDLAGQLRMKQ